MIKTIKHDHDENTHKDKDQKKAPPEHTKRRNQKKAEKPEPDGDPKETPHAPRNHEQRHRNKRRGK